MKRFNYLHPFIKLIVFVYLTVTVCATVNPFVQIPIFIFTVCLCVMTKQRGVFTQIKYMLPLAFVMIVINLIFNRRGRNILIYIFDNPVTLESLLFSLLSSLALINMLLIFSLLVYAMTQNELLYLFSSKFPKTAMLFNITASFAGILNDRANDVSTVLKSKNIDVSKGKLKKRIKDAGAVLNVVIAFSIEGAVTSGESLAARWYGAARRTSVSYFKFRAADFYWAAVATVIFAAVLYFVMTSTFEIYPRLRW